MQSRKFQTPYILKQTFFKPLPLFQGNFIPLPLEIVCRGTSLLTYRTPYKIFTKFHTPWIFPENFQALKKSSDRVSSLKNDQPLSFEFPFQRYMICLDWQKNIFRFRTLKINIELNQNVQFQTNCTCLYVEVFAETTKFTNLDEKLL